MSCQTGLPHYSHTFLLKYLKNNTNELEESELEESEIEEKINLIYARDWQSGRRLKKTLENAYGAIIAAVSLFVITWANKKPNEPMPTRTAGIPSEKNQRKNKTFLTLLS